ncbi:hypothetical protein AJ78_07544 [Emergomyces pasteurianus Ep9510]|uniref:Wax synthase domain-containing protein n=1 Tax=Emergomyces pasteurianus Ep9510 TaxID=1447872 RepID=A0A1J9Q686_9EURO|nr:hypothetical protein AJ78_07544 [Emergomyces pasteurianus Ep9510]
MTFHFFIPYISITLSIALQGITLLNIPPNSYKRVCMLPVILLPVAIVYLTAQYASAVAPWNVFIGVEFGSVFGLEVLDNVCLSKKSYAAEAGHEKQTKKNADITDKHTAVFKWKNFYDKVRWSLDIAINKRQVNRVNQARNVPYFDSRRPHHIPSRRSFLVFRLTRFVLLYLALDFITSQPPLEDRQVKFAPGKEQIFARILAKDISAAEFGESFAVILGHGICAYTSLLMGWDFFSVVSVGLFKAQVADWKPLFGDIRRVYTIRTFWRNFWHQVVLRPLESITSFIVHSVLCLPRRPKSTTRITNGDGNGKEHPNQTKLRPRDKLLFFITDCIKLNTLFLVSGLVHINSDRQLGITFRDTRCMSLFVRQAWGIMFEDAVQWMYRCITGSKGDGPVKLWHRLVGYMWLVIFALWSVPPWVFSSARMEVAPFVVPVTIFRTG